MPVSSLDMSQEISRLTGIAAAHTALLAKHNALLQAAVPVADALDQFGQHNAGCLAGRFPYKEASCDCGLAAALKQAQIVRSLGGQS